jgi:D-alanyl-lipoteichoic acid acyltransferase DltB (MBOAT superfamily)
MLFNSIEFAFFLPIVFLLYWFVINKNLKIQNSFLLIASYFFYGWWDWRFLSLLVILSIFNYFIGILIDKNEIDRSKKIWLYLGLIVNIGLLGVFKYYNFFVDSFINLISVIGYNLPKSTTKIILPLGISFYVFLSLSYIIDIYKHNLKANRNIVEVLLSLSFFPIILAGPIQRPSTLLPQIARRREFSYDTSVDGLRQILWGLFVKIVIADNLAPEADTIFLNFSDYSGSTLFLGMVIYSFQIYADFSGYSNIAIGTAKLFGFRLMQNFAYPYFSRDITEFWKKWHISLTTWFRDYIFLPLSFLISWKTKNERVLFFKKDHFIYIVASIIVWFLTGLWHGANYTFIIWGMINGLFLIFYHLQNRARKKLFKKLSINNNNSIIVITETIITLSFIMLAWIFFRADSIHHALQYIDEMFSLSIFSLPQVLPKKALLLTFFFIFFEWLQRDKEHALQIENIKYRVLRWGIYLSITWLIFFFGGGAQKFIYFQF